MGTSARYVRSRIGSFLIAAFVGLLAKVALVLFPFSILHLVMRAPVDHLLTLFSMIPHVLGAAMMISSVALYVAIIDLQHRARVYDPVRGSLSVPSEA